MTRVALVTGGARGIGRSIALELRRDHRVAVTWNTTEPDTLPDDILALQANLAEPEAARNVVEKVVDAHGRLDVIVNNAGLIHAGSAQASSADAALEILNVNLVAPDTLLAAALPHLNEGAAVVNISSINATLPPRGASMYGASKAGLNLWTRAMAKELGPSGIRVNAVAPGAINTPENPRPAELTELFVKETALGRIGTPQDIARVVRFLASEDASFITGEVLTVSGGYRL